MKRYGAKPFDPVAPRIAALPLTGVASVPASHKDCGKIYKTSDDSRFAFIAYLDESDLENQKRRIGYLMLSRFCDPLDEMGHDAPDTTEQIAAQERQDRQANGLRLLGYNDKLTAVGQRLSHANGTRKKRTDAKQDAHVIEVEIPQEPENE